MFARFAFVLLFFSSIVSAQPVRTWVSSTGTDNLTCSRATPCRTFGAAVAAVASGGEVVVVDSGGYGPVVIPTSVSIIAPAGIHAAIAPTSGTAIEISANSSDVVRLVNLQLTAHGATGGIRFLAGSSLSIENCAIDGFLDWNVDVRTGHTTLVDSLVRNGNNHGVSVGEGTPEATLTVDHSRFDRNLKGVQGYPDSHIVIANSLATWNDYGFLTGGGYGEGQSDLTVENSVVNFSGYGIVAFGAGFAAASTTLRLSNTTVVNCLVNGITIENGAVGYSRVNNTIHGNATNRVGSLTALPAE